MLRDHNPYIAYEFNPLIGACGTRRNSSLYSLRALTAPNKKDFSFQNICPTTQPTPPTESLFSLLSCEGIVVAVVDGGKIRVFPFFFFFAIDVNFLKRGT